MWKDVERGDELDASLKKTDEEIEALDGYIEL